MNLKNMRIGGRLALAFTVVLALTMVVTATSVARLQRVDTATQHMAATVYKLRLAEKWYAGNTANNGMTEARLRSTDANDDASIVARMKAKSAEISLVQQELKSLLRSSESQQLFETAGQKRQAYLDIRTRVFDIKNGDAKDQPAALALANEKMLPASAAYDQAVADLAKHEQDRFTKDKDEVEATVASGQTFLMTSGAVVVLLGALLAWRLTRSITVPLRHAVAVARTVADGDLSLAVEATSTDETGQLLQALQDMTGKLNEIVGRVRAGSDTIAASSNEVATGNLDLSTRTEQQASAIEETAASIEELSTTVLNNAQNVHEANRVAASASEIASKGGAVVAQVVDTMGAINESAKRIVDIISVIDGIAFQTNILALNAAVEAARAGEQGRGFAVVAAEVRALAQRSAAAAKEIKSLIDDSVVKVNAGSTLVNQAGATMDAVVKSVSQVTGIMADIAAASQEQSEGIQQVNQAVRQMDQVTQQNAALVEEAAAATASMQEQAQQLTEAVSAFRLDQAHARHFSLAAPAAKKIGAAQRSIAAPATGR